MAEKAISEFTVRDLRGLWKPKKERLQLVPQPHPLPIRLHRAFSWMEIVEERDFEADQDQILLYTWIAFNAMYGKWDPVNCYPESERESIKNFVSMINKIDRNTLIEKCLDQNKEQTVELLSDQYLNKLYWRSIYSDTKFQESISRNRAVGWFESKDYTTLFSTSIERIYFNRCQLSHGAATAGSNLNRISISRSARLLTEFMKVILFVVIDNGIGQDWDNMCYPPVD
ncbi:MAG: HEPN domain-containing protein [Pirellulaceae bacterium]